jgi:OOP family OmpA-OmpF porin
MKTLLLSLFVLLTLTVSAQENALKADENNALLHVKVTDMDGKIRIKDRIIFEGQKQTLAAISNDQGAFDILLPEGDEYLIKIVGLGEEEEYSKIVIGEEEGYYEGNIVIRYEPAKSYTLDDVQFDTGKSSLRPSSYPTLDNLVAALELKDQMRLEIAGHTDDRGDDAANLKLSQARAEAVVAYLISKGIAADRLIAKGYGEAQPIASNDSPEGRQQNRRTEARLLEDVAE